MSRDVVDSGYIDNAPPLDRHLHAIGWLVAYWALGRDPTDADEELVAQLHGAIGQTSVPEAAGVIDQSLREAAM